jgi:hypothetical protein
MDRWQRRESGLWELPSEERGRLFRARHRMWPPQGGTPIASSITVFPSLPTLSQSGQTEEFTAIVLDQNGNVLTPGAGGIPALVWSSSNPSVATVNASTGLATAVASGTASITATCGVHGGGTTLTVGAGSGSFHPNLPAGMTTVLDTGAMTNAVSQVQSGTWSSGGNVPATMTNESPNSPSSVGEWAGNISNVPSSSGFRMTYATDLHGGNSPARVQLSTFASKGTGFLYLAFRIRYATTWNYSTALSNKIVDTHTVTPGNNHIIDITNTGTDGNSHATGNAFPYYALQGTVSGNVPGGSRANGLPPSFTGSANVYANPSAANLLGAGQIGLWNTVEMYIQPESPVLTGNNGQFTEWVNGALQWTSVGKNDGTAGQTGINYNSGGFSDLLFDPTYGGDSDTDRPPAGCYWDIDYLFAAVA